MTRNIVGPYLFILFFTSFINITPAFCGLDLNDETERRRIATTIQHKKWGEPCIVTKDEGESGLREVYALTAMLSNKSINLTYIISVLRDLSNPSDFLKENVTVERVPSHNIPEELSYSGFPSAEFWNITNPQEKKGPHATYFIQFIGKENIS